MLVCLIQKSVTDNKDEAPGLAAKDARSLAPFRLWRHKKSQLIGKIVTKVGFREQSLSLRYKTEYHSFDSRLRH
jgi:hypothetical protein